MFEFLESRSPQSASPYPRLRAWSLALAAVAAVTAVIVVAQDRSDRAVPAECHHVRDVAWCSAVSTELGSSDLARLVLGYCPQLRGLQLGEVEPQPLALLDLTAREDAVMLRTAGARGRTETVLLGQPDRLAWVVRGGAPGLTRLEVVCHDSTERVPSLEFDGPQYLATLAADAGARSLDLRDAARAAASAVHATPGGDLAMGTLRCRTGRAALALRVGARFRCELPLFSDMGQAAVRASYRVGAGHAIRLLPS